MIVAEDYREALLAETMRLVDLVRGTGDDDQLALPTPCDGWSVLDVARHVEVTPRTVGLNLQAHFRGDSPPAVDRLPSGAGRAEVLESLEQGFRLLEEALESVSDATLEEAVPGPVGPMPGRAALDLALTELALHRCDIELALGGPAIIDKEAASAVTSVLQAWLLLISGSAPRPEAPMCYRLSDGSRTWSFHFDGTRWTTDGCNGRAVSVRASIDRLALALAGRIPFTGAVERTSDPKALDRLKVYLPGP